MLATFKITISIYQQLNPWPSCDPSPVSWTLAAAALYTRRGKPRPCDNRRTVYFSLPTLQAAYRLTESNKKHLFWRLPDIKYHPMSHLYVQTYHGTQDGWQSVGGRRTASDAERFCALLNRIRNNRISKVQAVPVRFVLGEWCSPSINQSGQPYRVNPSHLSRQSGAVHPVLFLYLSFNHV